jgi:hypothetical protein
MLFVVDALDHEVLGEWLEAGRLPTIAKLLQEGGVCRPCTSIFPSITPTATCSIAAGEYPRRTWIEGACWFDREGNETLYFGGGMMMAFQQGLQKFITDFGDRLNSELLHVPLIYEHLESRGIESACINYMWFRGSRSHERKTPLTAQVIAGKLDGGVCGPAVLKLGDFVESMPNGTRTLKGIKSGLTQRYGFHDDTTAECVLAMAESGRLPPFTLAYFPLNDVEAHERGLDVAASKRIEAFDQFLEEFVQALGGWDQFQQTTDVLIVGDHGQTRWGEGEPRIVDLKRQLQGHSIANTVEGFQAGDELLICPNLRAAAIYVSPSCSADYDSLGSELAAIEGVDQVIFPECRDGGLQTITVVTRDRGRLSFARASQQTDDWKESATDQYGNRWAIFGELEPLDLKIDPGGRLVDGDYPNALERIEGVFLDGKKPIWITAQPDTEFTVDHSATHQSGSHGSLHRKDSTSALVASSGVPVDDLPAPAHPRIVDVMDLCLACLGAGRAASRLAETV